MNRSFTFAAGFLFIILLAGCQSQLDPGTSRFAHHPNVIEIDLDGLSLIFRKIDPQEEKIDYPPYYMLETEVTNQMYARYLDATGRTKDDTEIEAQYLKRKKAGVFTTGDLPISIHNHSMLWRDNAFPKGKEEHPVTMLSLADAQAFCEWLNEEHENIGLFRLPTWNEWVYAAYGKSRAYPWGDEWDKSRVCMSYGRWNTTVVAKELENYHITTRILRARTEPVQARPAGRTPQGLYGMLGNVGEYISEADPINRKYFNLGARSMGGGFDDYNLWADDKPDEDLVSPREDYWGYSHYAALYYDSIGFRVMLDLSRDKGLLKHTRLFAPQNKSWLIESEE